MEPADFFVGVEEAAQIEGALARHLASYGSGIAQLWPQSGAAALALGRGWAARTGAALPINRATGLGMGGSVDTVELEALEAFFAAAGMPAQVELCPLADADLREQLSKRGYTPRHFMQVLVRRVGAAWQGAEPPGVAAEVVPRASAEGWVALVARAFSGGAAVAADTPGALLARSVTLRPEVQLFQATVDGVPAAAGALAIDGETALLFSTSTLPAQRQRGAQAVLIRTRLRAAAEAGCRIVAVQTTPGAPSQRNLWRQGFRVAYTNMIVSR